MKKAILITLPIILFAYLVGDLMASVGDKMCLEPFVFTRWLALRITFIFGMLLLIGFRAGQYYEDNREL